MPRKVCLVGSERDEEHRSLLDALSEEGLRYQTVPDADSLLNYLSQRGRKPSLVVIGDGLPDSHKHDLCRWVREKSLVPIIVISSNPDPVNCVLSLEVGADDHLVRPFGYKEFVARVLAKIRRMENYNGNGQTEDVFLEARGLQVDLITWSVDMNGKEVYLTPKEMELLRVLMSNRGRVMPSERLMERIWGDMPLSRTLAVYIGRLRAKLDDHDKKLITTVKGVGYRFEA